MKIIIPMTGYGSRFAAAGYKDLKPLIKVNGKPMIEWIVKGMYSQDDDFLFICRDEHLKNIPEMLPTLKRIAPDGKIFSVTDWKKKGPVSDVLRAADEIDDNEPCIINYCDFYMSWDREKFYHDIKECDCDGAVPCYTGFHPNLEPKQNLYASCRTDENGYLIEIREKYSFEKDKYQALHSPGVYYFKSGAIMKKYSRQLIDSGMTIKDEYYASLIYHFLVKDGLKVLVPANVIHFCQWGTPEDLRDYCFWIDTVGSAFSKTNILIPMAGEGKRFADEGYSLSKPAIPTTSHLTGEKLPMVVCAVKDVPFVREDGSNVIFVDRTHHQTSGVEDIIRQSFPKAQFITLDHLTEGQASTCLTAKEWINNAAPLMIAGCDNGMVYDRNRLNAVMNEADVIVFTYRNDPRVLDNPKAYGWIKVDENDNVTDVSVKQPISDTPMNDHAVVATFWFRHGSDFVECAEEMIAANDRINNEFYADQVVKYAVKKGLRTKVFEIERYIGWGTPKEYEYYEKCFEYWKNFAQSKDFLG